MSRNFEVLTQLQSELGQGGVTGAAAQTARVTSETVIPRERVDNAVSDEMLNLVQRVFLSANGSARRKVLFCGVDDGAGSSSVCARAAEILANHSSRPVCLVDANLQAQRLSRMFAVDATILSSAGSVSIRERCAQVGANLWLAGAGLLTGGGGSFLALDELKERLSQLRGEFEYLLIDVAGANVRGDAAVLGQATDAAILVVEANGTRRVAALKAKETLDAANVRLLGTVLHNRTFPIPEQLYRKL
jgi:Mrp family chromosome partitioning ATPase